MKTKIGPVLVSECPALGWKTKKKESARVNLLELLGKINGLADALRSGKLPAKEHLAARGTLKAALEQIGIGIQASALIEKALQEKWAEEKSKALEKKTQVTLLRELLKLAQNEPKLLAKSHTYDEAWLEVESHYFAKMSLYRAELARRK